ncbi:MAG: NAD-dependent epimerase/dehydratase family protein [Candidatus Aenigmatarchaeota archaeon]
MELKGKKILVTGGAGFIGSRLVEKLLENNDVAILDRTAGKTFNAKARVIDGDLLDRDFVARNAKGFDFVFHLAANPNPQENSYAQNVQMTKNLLDAMALNNIKALGFASSVLVYGNAETPTKEEAPLRPKSLYGASKAECEALISSYCALKGFRAWIFRFANVAGAGLTHGPVFDFARKLQTNPKELEVLGDGSQSRCYVYIDDCLEGVFKALALDNAVNIVNIGAEDTITIKAMAEMATKAMARKTGETAKIVYTGKSWSGDVQKTQPDITKIKSLGFKPKYTSEQAVKKAFDAFLGQNVKS